MFMSGDKRNKFAFSTCSVTAGIAAATMLMLVGCGSEPDGDAKQQAVSVMSDFSISDPIIQAHIRSNGLDASGARYERSVQSFVENNALAYAIATQGDGISSDVAYKITNSRNTALIKAYLDEHVSSVVSDEVVQQYYNDNIDKYSTKRVKGAHILISLNGVDQEQRKEKELLAVELMERARKGDEFAQLVKEHSDDKKTSEKGGELGWMSNQDEADSLLVKALLVMSEGGISEPVETEQGLHILKLLEGPLVEKMEFDAVKGKIEYHLKYEERIKEIKRLKSIAKEKVESDMSALGMLSN